MKSIVLDYPWYTLLLCFVAAAAITAVSYYKNKRLAEFQSYKIYILAGLRFTALFITGILLLNIFIKTQTNRTEKPVLPVVIDNSGSMIMRGEGSGDSLKAFYSTLMQAVDNLKDNYNVKLYTFGSNLSSDTSLNFAEKATDYSQMLDALKNGLYNTNANSLILCSDGICNKGQNPVYAAQQSGFKIFTVAMGDTTQYCDLSISKTVYNETSFLGNEFSIEVSASAKMLKGQKSICEITHKGKTVFSEPINIASDGYIQNITATLKASEKGLQKYTVSLRPLNNEITTENNTREIVIDIIDDKYKILILSEYPHPDVAALRSALSFNLSYDLTVSTVEEFGDKAVTGFNLVVLVQLPSANAQFVNRLTEMQRKGIPTLFVAGAKTDIAAFNKLNRCIEIEPSGNSFEDAMPSANINFPLFALEQRTTDFLTRTPPLNCRFGTYNVLPAAKVLAYQKIKNVQTTKPLIAICDPSVAKSAVIAGEGLWRWRIDCYKRYRTHEMFDQFIGRIVQFLVSRNTQEQFSLTSQRIYNLGDPVCFSAKVADKQMQPITDAEVTITISNDNNFRQTYTLQPAASGYFLRIDTLKTGTYNFESTAKFRGGKLTKSGGFSIIENFAETEDLRANHTVLQKMSTTTGGKMYYPADITTMSHDLITLRDAKPVIFTETTTAGLIELRWLFYLILILLTAEWVMRKWWGTV